MSSPSSLAQKGLCEEDSSGSDGGSEVGHEPETDRFGFIVTNGCTAGSVGPPPELVRQREAKWLNIISKWDLNMLKKYHKVKVLCQKGIPASLKSKCWPLLCAATERMKQSKDLYQSLDSQSALQSWVDVIERDLDRQFPFHEMFLSKDGHGQRGLFRVLKAYTQYQPEEGYCQAQGPVAAVLLMNMPAEEAFWCLVQISEQYLPGYYSPLLEGVLFDAAMLNWVLKRTCPAAHKHLQHHGVEPLMYATDWLMCLFTRHLPFNKLLRVWDLFFCYGVRVLLQVAVVLVRRVLGRAEQRKQCQGQMETLEKLRGVREQVEDEDDAFIAEVCSVPLSGKDIEKQTEKELQKWRKDKPASTFDPRVRCQGYQMVWGKARQNEQDRDKKEREKGNLSIPLARSASTLSLSPSILHKKWRKGGKANTGEWEGGGKVVRHLSMGGNEDWKSWTELNLKKVQGLQEEEDTFTEEQKQQSETKLTGQTEQKESKKVDNIQNIQTEQVEETVKEETDVKTRTPEEEDSELKESQESKTLAEQPEETNVETEPAKDPAKDQTVENILQQGEELDSDSQSQDVEQQSHESNGQETDAKDTTEETEKQEVESEHKAAEEENLTEVQKDEDAETNTEVEETDVSEELVIQADVKPEESTEIEIVQQTQVDAVTDVSEMPTETSLGSETDSEAPPVTDPTAETETQQLQQEVIVESEHKAAEEENLTEVQKDVDAETNTEVEETDVSEELGIVQQTQVDALTEVSETPTETSQGSETESEAPPVTDPTAETETQQEVIEETDNSSEDASEGKHLSTDSLAETDIKEESLTHTVTETDTLAQTQETVEENVAIADELEAEKDPKDSEQHRDSETEVETVILYEPEDITPNECNDLVADTETQVEKPLSDDIVSDSSEAFAQHSEDCDTGAFEPPQETTVRLITTNSEADNDQTKTEETPTETQIMEETADSTPPPQEEGTSAQGEEVNLNTEPGGETNSVEMSTFEEPAPEELKIEATSGAEEEVRNTENVQEQNSTAQEVTISTEPTDSIIDSKPQITDKESQLVENQLEPKNSDLKQASGQCSSFSSGDFRIRKSSSSRGSKLGRRLSEDLFTVPQKPSQSQSIPNQPEVKHTESQSNSGAANTTQTPSDVNQSSAVTSALSQEAADRKEEQQNEPEPSKRFGLFRRLRGEQVEKAKAKKKPKMQVPKILIQDFSDATETEKPVEEEEKLSSRERRRRRRERERQEKEEERLRKKREKEVEKEKERRKPKTRGKSFQVQREKGSTEEPQPEKTGSQTLRHSASYAESYF